MVGSIVRSESLYHFKPETDYQAAEQREAILTRMVREQVIPTLLRRTTERIPDPNLAVEQLTTLCLRGDAGAVVASVIASFQADRSAERLCRDLLTPTARYLGKCWEEDYCTFVEVTLGVAHLETALRAVQPLFHNALLPEAKDAYRILLMPVPGGHHSFGLSMLAASFARAGWDASVVRVDRYQDLTDIINARRVDVIGFSVSHSELLDTARDAIAVVRAIGSDEAPAIMVGGPVLIADPSLVGTLGADGMALDEVGAVETALRLSRPMSRLEKLSHGRRACSNG